MTNIKWYDIREKVDKLKPINIIIGGRGIGKTYSTLLFLIEQGEKFIYLRNTDSQMSECMGLFGNPFKRINLDKGYDIRIEKERKHYLINRYTDENEFENIGYGCALSTFENLRGVDLSDVKYVLFDEFIERRTLTFDQFASFASFYETVNRNRELLGDEPLKCILLSNAQKLGNPILSGYNVIPIIENMIRNNQRTYRSKNMFIDLPESEVSERKRATAQYELIKDTQYSKEVLDNKFAYDSFYGIGKQKIQEFKPLCIIDGMTVYKHKSKLLYYVCTTHADIIEFNSKDQGLLWMRNYGQYFREAYAQGKFTFSDFTTKICFAKLIGM